MKNNRTGSKNKLQNVYTITDLYDHYISDKEKQSVYDVSRKDFHKILDEYFIYIASQINEGRIFYIPYGLGSVYVVKKKTQIHYKNRLSVDWATTNKIGKKVYHLNEHSNGYKYMFKWDKLPLKFRNHRLYRFATVRGIKRALAKCIKNLGYNYIEE